MINGYDILYSAGVALASPYWLLKGKARRKVLGALSQRMGHVGRRAGGRPAVMIHAVSMGEMNATRALVKMLQEKRPELQFIVSTTTETGYARGKELYGADAGVTLIRYPLDFTPAVGRVLNGLRPSVVVLMELEVWPNFIRMCARREIPVLLVNGRLTEQSFRHYKWGGPLTRGMFARLACLCAQDQTYAKRFIELGAAAARVHVTGTMKFDTAQIAQGISGAEELAGAVGLGAGKERVWVCGSTGPGEEEIVLGCYRELRGKFPGLRLAIVPRHPERFNEVAELIVKSGFEVVRRSQGMAGARGSAGAVVLGDTMGELRKFYSLADVVFVGRTLVDLGPRQHGSDMMEPAALGKAVIVGRFTGNFADAMQKFREGKAMAEVNDAKELGEAVERLLSGAGESEGMGRRAQEVVRREQGATARHVELILEQLGEGKGRGRQ